MINALKKVKQGEGGKVGDRRMFLYSRVSRQRAEGGEGEIHADIWEESRYKGPGAAGCHREALEEEEMSQRVAHDSVLLRGAGL